MTLGALPTQRGPVPAGDRVAVGSLDPEWLDRAAEVLALSFVDEPAFRWMLDGSPRRRLRVLRPSFRAGLRGYGSAEMHGAMLEGELIGVGIRFPPGRWPETGWDSISSTVWGLISFLPQLAANRRALRMLTATSDLKRLHPTDRPHWYLTTMGVHPEFRRRGVASALARYVIGRADEAGVGVYTETFGDGTEALYRGFGFEVRDRFEIAPGAPMGRTMWREPPRPIARVG